MINAIKIMFQLSLILFSVTYGFLYLLELNALFAPCLLITFLSVNWFNINKYKVE